MIRYFALCISLILTLSSCKNHTDVVEDLTNSSPIVQTDVTGTVVVDSDPSQWQPRPTTPPGVMGGGFFFGPAYPNPTTSDTVFVPYVCAVAQNISILVYSEVHGSPVDTIFVGSRNAGKYRFLWKRRIPKGIYRVELKMSHFSSSSYGNVQFK